MTRRKQGVPKRHQGLENSDENSYSQGSVDCRPVISESRLEDADGDTTSEEDTSGGMQVDVKAAQLSVLGNGQISGQCNGSPRRLSRSDDRSDNGQGGECVFINGSRLSCGREICIPNRHGARKQPTLGLVHLTESFPSFKLDSYCDSYASNRHKQNTSTTSSVSPSPAPASTGVLPQMALVVSTLPFELVHGSQNSQNHIQPGMTYFSSSAEEQQDDQPLDLSRKPARSASFSTTETKLVVLRNRSCSDSVTSIPLPANDFSSLWSLQQRFGDDVPLHPSHKSAATVIPLPANVTCKSAVRLNGVRPENNLPPPTGLERQHPICQVDTSEEHNMAAVEHRVVEEENNMVASPVLSDEAASGGWSRHTTHRCSCQNTFSTLYSLSLHLQETGHTPSSSKGSSPMDYPKLVRGQDMWLNQESEQTRRILRCIQCGESFESLPLLTVHMMQTQHYTKIVNSDHARRPHKCSTYCGRELHQECVFKCKVCHQTFGDMERLASHMVVSGHHIKQMPRHVLVSGHRIKQMPNQLVLSGHHIKQMPRHLVNPVAVGGDVSATPRPGKRKRCSQDDTLPVVASSVTVASLLNYRTTRNGVSKCEGKDITSELEASGHRTSPESRSVLLVTCGICEKDIESLSFNSHVRECLRQKVEVIELLGKRLALEENLLSKSEGTLLKPDCSLDYATHQQKISGLASTKTESVSSEDNESGCVKGSEKSLSESSVEIMFPERSRSTLSSDLGQMIRHSASPGTKLSASPGTTLCDLQEVPHKKWCSHSESRQEESRQEESRQGVNKCFMSADDEDYWAVNFNERTLSPPVNPQFTACSASKNIDSHASHEEVVHTLKSEPRHGDDGLCDFKIDVVSDDLSKVEQRRERLSPPNCVLESTLESLDCTYSALYKLDLFSRGLQLSPPRRTTTLETKLLNPQQSKVTSKKELLPIYNRNPMSKSPPGIRSPQTISSPHTVSSPYLQHFKPESPSPSDVNMTFDIIDPYVEPQSTTSAPSALEAMESFINKSFSAKPQLCSPSLTSMFSPFRNYFPNTGSVLPNGGMLLDSPNATASQLAKFSRFFKMVPGIPMYSRSALSPAVDTIKRGANMNRSQLNTSNPAALVSLSEYHLGAFTPICSAPEVRYKLELPKNGTICQADDNSKNNSVGIIPTIKTQNHKRESSPDLFTAQKSHACGSSADAVVVQENHTFDSTPTFIAEKSHKHYGFANHLIAEQNHKYFSFLDTSVGETSVAQDLYRISDKILGHMQADCTDDIVLSRPFFVKSLNSSSQRRARVESSTVGQDRNCGSVSSTRAAGSRYSQQGGNQDDTMWVGDQIFINDNITDVIVASKSTVNITDENIQVDRELENHQLTTEVKRGQGDKVAPNSNVNSSAETTKLTLQTEAGDRKHNRQVAEDAFNIHVADSEIDTDMSVKTESEADTNVPVKTESEVDTNVPVKTESKVHTNVPVKTESKVHTNVPVKTESKVHTNVPVKTESKVDTNVPVKTESKFDTNVPVKTESKVHTNVPVKTESKVDTNVPVKTESEEKAIKERVNVNPNEEKAREKNLNSSLEIHGNKMSSKPTATEDKCGHTIKPEPCLDSSGAEIERCSCTNKRVGKNDSFVTDFIQQDTGDTGSKNVSRDILTGSLKDAFCNEHESSRSNCCKSGSDKDKEKKFTTSTTQSTSVQRATVPGRYVLCGDTNSENVILSYDNKCDISDLNVVADNILERHFDDLISDTARENVRKGKCSDVQINIEYIVDDQVICDRNVSENLNVICMNNMINAENNNHSVGHNDCTVSRNWCEDATKLEVSQSANDVHRGEGKQDTGVELNNEEHCNNNIGSVCFTQLSAFDCEVTGSSMCKNKSSVQRVDKLTRIKSVNDEKIVITEKYQCRQAGLHEKNNQGTSVQVKHPKCLSESETNLNAKKMDIMKKKKSALDYLSSFVYSQPLPTEHPLDNLQQLLATNDLSHLPADPDNHSVVASHNCFSSDTFTSPSMIPGRGQTCSTCDTEDNEDDETYLTETGTGESNVHGHKCGACRRRFVSKGSYRYHLSRCHLSSVKKYSIKERFSRSPYVYLPLDHTVSLSKYYQMTQGLSPEGK